MQGTIKNDVRRRLHIRIHTKRFDHFYCKKWEILRAAIIGILLLACKEILLHNMPTGITFAEKQKNDNFSFQSEKDEAARIIGGCRR